MPQGSFFKCHQDVMLSVYGDPGTESGATSLNYFFFLDLADSFALS